MSHAAWQIGHAVETAASLAFAWTYMTNVVNWDDPPAQFQLDGLFAAGSRGVTHMPGQPPMHWRLADVQPMEYYVIESQLDRASLSVTWRFEAIADARTRLTQTIALTGENFAAFEEPVRAAFEPNLPPGMNRIAAAIGSAAAIRNVAASLLS